MKPEPHPTALEAEASNSRSDVASGTAQVRLPDDPDLRVAHTIGDLMRFWGFKRPMGRIWTILYLSPHPLSAHDIGERLGMSAGGVSMALSELERWGAVIRISPAGERRDYFTAEPSVWKMVRGVLEQRELRLVERFRSSLGDAIADLPPTGALDAGADSPNDFSYKRERLERLEQLARTGEQLLSALVAGSAVDPTKFFDPKS